MIPNMMRPSMLSRHESKQFDDRVAPDTQTLKRLTGQTNTQHNLAPKHDPQHEAKQFDD